MQLKRLAIAVAAAAVFIAVFGTVPASASSSVLKREAEGSSVKQLQMDLKRLGYLSADATGYYGGATEEAVKQLQKEYGYKMDGVAGNTTLSLVDRLLNRKNASTVNTSKAATLKEGDENTGVTELQKKLIKLGYLSTKPTGFYGDATTTAVKRLQNKYGYKADGIAGTSTLSLLDKLASGQKLDSTAKVSDVKEASYISATGTEKNSEASKKAVTGDTEAQKATTKKTSAQKNYMLPWFGNVDKTFAIGETATVYDIRTGLSFKVKRTYGHNHADCETLTAKDTATMKKLYGGKWSWDTRPVIVSVDGLKLAASIAGMPHAGVDGYSAGSRVSSRSGGYGRGTNLDKVKNNKMNGHFDIHFYKSKNHYNNKTDPRHQASVKQAEKYAESHYASK